jgi:hypothetical protein
MKSWPVALGGTVIVAYGGVKTHPLLAGVMMQVPVIKPERV